MSGIQKHEKGKELKTKTKQQIRRLADT